MRLHLVLPALLITLALPGRSTYAQAGVSFWAGYATAADSGKAKFAKNGLQGAVQLGVPLVPIGVRAEGLVWGSSLSHVAFITSGLVQLRLPLAQLYAIAGYGNYPVRDDFKTSGWNAGVGGRVGLGRLGAFAEVRRHDAIDRTVTTLGVTF